MKTNYTTQPEKAYEKPGEWGTVQYTSISYEMPAQNAFVEESEKDYSNEYLTTVALEDGTISFNVRFDMGTEYITSISYSTDNGKTWTTTANQDDKEENLVIDVNVNKDDKVLWKGIATQTGCWSPNDDVDDIVGSFFSSDCEFDASGNVMSLLYDDDFRGKTTIENAYEFVQLFHDYDGENECLIINAKNLSLPATTLAEGCYQLMFSNCASLITAPKLPATTLTTQCYNYMFNCCASLITAPILPATTLAEGCYTNMFRYCTSLTTTPELPATTLAYDCYSSMFSGCTALTTASILPAKTLVADCYSYMFYGCTSLTIAPELPATALARNCYNYMFSSCTSLVTAPSILPAITLAESCCAYMFQNCTSLTMPPELPATTLVENCYTGMFTGCTSLTTASILPATTLVSSCYAYMFKNCTSLNSVTCLATNRNGNDCTFDWLRNVSVNGTFTKATGMEAWSTDSSGIPTGWTVQNA